MKKRIISLLLAVVLVLTCAPVSVFAAGASDATVKVDTVTAAVGATVDVNVKITGNPGVAGATFKLSYSSDLTLINAVSGSAFSGLDFTKPGTFTNPCNFTWDSENYEATADGTVLTLTFKVSDTAEKNKKLNVDLSYRSGDIFNNEKDLVLDITNGKVVVLDYIPGDLYEDGVHNTKDTRLMRQYIAGGYDITINENAADVNADGVVNSKDTRRLRRYMAGGYEDSATLLPGCICNHIMAATAANDATCTDNGNYAYWYCASCDKYFSDAEGYTEIELEDTVIKSYGHTVVTDPAVAPTYTSTGLTEGSHCSVCNKVFTTQEIVPVLKGYSITYNIANGDSYIAAQTIENTNKTSYTPEDEAIVLKHLIAPAGYTFLGWYDGAGDNATEIKMIPKGSTRDWELYAHWQKEPYTVSFASDMVPVESIEYTVDKKVVLPSPKLDKYTFVGWTDDENNLWTEIPSGTAKNINLYANWSSNRNQAKAVDSLADPIIIEDSENKIMMFAYEIGTIERVPLYTILNLQCANGIITTHSRTEESSISTQTAKTIATTISNSTTNSASWTLSKDWNSSTDISTKYNNTTETTEERARELSQNSSGEYYVGQSYGGSKTYVNTANGSFNFSMNQDHSKTLTEEREQSIDLSVDGKYSKELSAGVEFGIPVEGLDLGIKAGNKSTFEIGAGADYHQGKTTTTSGTDSWGTDSEIGFEVSRSKTNEKHWNAESGYKISNSTEVTDSIANKVSNIISKETGYGQSYSEGGSNSEAKELASTNSTSDNFSSTIAYHTNEIVTETTTFSSTGNTFGNYRLIMAGKIHVFAIVGYDIAQNTYFVTTYNVLDDTTEEYLDYSVDGSFNDYETSIVPFKVPGFVNDYVNNRIAMTDGLRVDLDTGIIDHYTPVSTNPATIISVPSYVRVETGDSTGYKAVKVTGISSDLFRGNKDVVGVVLGHHITEIPDNAFEGCTSLEYIICPGVTKIGDNAFSGCTSLKKFTVPYLLKEWKCSVCGNIETTDTDCVVSGKCSVCDSEDKWEEITTDEVSIGSNAFAEVPEIFAAASSAEVAQAVAASGATKTVLDISKIPADEVENLALEVGNVSYFEVQGRDKQYKNFSLVSDATTTVVNGVKIIDGTGVAIKTTSENLKLNRVTIDSDGYALLLSNDNTNITVNGNINLSSDSGNAVVCKSIAISPLSTSVVGKMNVTGKMLVYGTIEGEKYLNCDNIEYITEEQFAQYEKGLITISFNANGGSVADTTVTTYFGKAVGALPVPIRANYTFVGWFTEASGGTEVTKDTVLPEVKDVILYAHWSLITYTVYFNANGGAVGTSSKTVDSNGVYGSLPTPTRSGYKFDGWYTATSGGTQITENTAVNLNGNQTLYAHWSQYTLSFNANGGSGGPGTQYGYGSTTISSTAPSRTNYDFLGWSESSSASSPSYYAGGTIGLYSSTTLYAVWKLKTVSMLSYIGWYYTDAQTNLNNLGLNVAFNYAYNYNYAYGVVYAQNYGQGTILNAGSTVTLTYSLGTKPYAVGDRVEFDGGYFLSSLNSSATKTYKAGTSQNGYFYITDLRKVYNGKGYYGLRFDGASTRYGWVEESLIHQRTN